MPKRRKPSRNQVGLSGRLVLPAIAIVVAVVSSAVAVTAGTRADGAPLLALMPVNALLAVASPVLGGMMLLLAAGKQVSWRRALTGVALLVAATALAATGLVLFGLGFRAYVGQRATEPELKAAAAALVTRQREGARATYALRELPDASALEPVRRLRPSSVRVDAGVGGKHREVYLGWESPAYRWGVLVTPEKVTYARGE
jgi:hypothetical protein